MQGNTDTNGKCTNIRTINAYRVSHKQVTDRSHTLYIQQYKQQLKEGNPTPTPHSQIIYDLSEFIQECKSQGEEVIMCLDANEELTKDRNPKKAACPNSPKIILWYVHMNFWGTQGGKQNKRQEDRLYLGDNRHIIFDH